MKVGDQLVGAGLITRGQLDSILAYQQTLKERKKILTLLVEREIIGFEELFSFFLSQCRKGEINIDTLISNFPASEEEILARVADELDLELADLDHIKIQPEVQGLVPLSQIIRLLAFPVMEDERVFSVVLFDPFSLETREYFSRTLRKKPVQYLLVKKEQISRKLATLKLQESVRDLERRIKQEIRTGGEGAGVSNSNNSSIMQLIAKIFDHAVESKASDVHIEAHEEQCVVRCRIDGVLSESFLFDKEMHAPLASRLKLLSDLDIAEKRKPQDGRFSLEVAGREFDFRISTLPIITGESVVVRILDKSKVLVRLEEMGMSGGNMERFQKAIKSPYGIVFVTGPTGSGKTTTLYASLNAIKSVGQKIITVEDPVEYQMEMIHQVMVNERAGLGFSAALRSILRQDPDIIMVGEIRDKETMKIAIQAALTGHLVLTTLHTNDAISGVSRLLDMGIESFFVGTSMAGIEAQRLVRRLCVQCSYEVELPPSILQEVRPYLPEDACFHRSRGCHACNMTGYLGRELISEVLLATEPIKKLVIANAPKEEISAEARSGGFITMFEDGIHKAARGLTSIEEIYRVAKLP